MAIRRYLAYLIAVLRHKYYVFLACLQVGGIPILSALYHDLDKFTPAMFGAYARNFYNTDGTKKAKGEYYELPEFDQAWNSHQKRNKHHWQYWLITYDDGSSVALRMPDRHMREMLADWIGAGRAYGDPNTGGWYAKNRDRIRLNEDTRTALEDLMYDLFGDDTDGPK